MLRSAFSAATAGACVTALCVMARADPPVVIELPGLTPGGSAEAAAINDLGNVAGAVEVEIPGCFHAALWLGGTPIDLGVLGTPPSVPFSSSSARDVNNLGDVVGYSMTAGNSFNSHAFLWTAGAMRDLGVLGTFTVQVGNSSVTMIASSQANAVNDRRQVVGVTSTSSSSRRAFLWQDGTMTELRSLEPEPDALSEAKDINNAGQIVGQSNGRAVIWENGEIRALPVLDERFGEATAINALGQVVGTGFVYDEVKQNPRPRGFFWDGRRLVELRPLPGDSDSRATGLNERGQVIGVSNPENRQKRLVLWENGEPIALQGLPLGTGHSFSMEINSRGQIVGTQSDDLYGHFAFARCVRSHRTARR